MVTIIIILIIIMVIKELLRLSVDVFGAPERSQGYRLE